MSERDTYPAGVPCWVVALQADPEAAVAFYGPLFEWELVPAGPMPPDPSTRYFVARVEGRDVAAIAPLPQTGGDVAPAWMTHVSVGSADETARKAADAGGTVLADPFDLPPEGRLAVLADPAGAVLCAWEAGTRAGAQLVNEPGAWAMSALRTPDPDAANAFYGAVFGWQPEAFGPPEAGVSMWRRPGYVGGEPQQPVPRDVVSVLLPAPADAPAQWGVDFWVRDADATAEHADRLGGQVVVAPHDTPGFRTAVLADPEGATFSISQLVLAPPAGG